MREERKRAETVNAVEPFIAIVDLYADGLRGETNANELATEATMSVDGEAVATGSSKEPHTKRYKELVATQVDITMKDWKL